MIEIKGHAIVRDGQEIGRIDGDVAYMTAMPPSIIKGQIRKAAGNSALAFELEDEKPEDIPTIRVPRVRIEAAPSTLAELEAYAKARQMAIPDKHPAMGDKTPAFVEWVRAHLSEDDFRRHYHRRKLPESMQAFQEKDNIVAKRLDAAERKPAQL